MKPYICACILLVATSLAARGQEVQQRLHQAVQSFVNDEQMSAALLGFYVADAATGKMVYSHNGDKGLAPASAQKIVTSAAALELPGPGYTYATQVYIDRKSRQVYISGNGDPSLGSWRYRDRPENDFLVKLGALLKQNGIDRIPVLHAITGAWETQTLPGGWIWDDIGNYYGAGVSALNWKENQYDLLLEPGNRQGEPVRIAGTRPALQGITLVSELTTGAPGSGDNGYIYLPPYSTTGYVRGTVPPGKTFTISGSIPNPPLHFVQTVAAHLRSAGITVDEVRVQSSASLPAEAAMTYTSPGMDSLVYWFLQKSINLYGEALVKTLAHKKNGLGSSDEGLDIMRDFWKEKGIPPAALRMIDGSGLSPQNRVTAEGLVKVLQFARSRPWFNAYLAGFPTYNNMKMKSGTIGGAKAFAGYHTSATGTRYSFAIIVNNYTGAAGSVVQKMYKVLDELKR